MSVLAMETRCAIYFIGAVCVGMVEVTQTVLVNPYSTFVFAAHNHKMRPVRQDNDGQAR